MPPVPALHPQAAHLALVESLLLCDLLPEALQAAQQLPGGCERQYLMAQAALRCGDARGASRWGAMFGRGAGEGRGVSAACFAMDPLEPIGGTVLCTEFV